MRLSRRAALGVLVCATVRPLAGQQARPVPGSPDDLIETFWQEVSLGPDRQEDRTVWVTRMRARRDEILKQTEGKPVSERSRQLWQEIKKILDAEP